MNSIDQHNKAARRGAITVLVVGIVVSIAVLLISAKTSSLCTVDTSEAKVSLNWMDPVALNNADWSVMQSSSGLTSADGGKVSKRFRLAGTFITYGGMQDNRKAILDDLVHSEQKIISENQEIDGFVVLRIFPDRVMIRGPEGEEQLKLSFTNTAKEPESQETPTANKKAFQEITGKFGKQVGKRSYVYNREALLGYYSELMDHPERLVAVFDSLKPIWTADRKIEGYELDIQGEADFFKEIGWKQGDIVRSVNSMKMTNRHRAEYFIREFVADRANAFLIDMERDNKPMKMVYRVR